MCKDEIKLNSKGSRGMWYSRRQLAQVEEVKGTERTR
jgi:hypothetical protein